MTRIEVSEKEKFLAAIDPHLTRLRLAELFMRVDVSWSGNEARAFSYLLKRLAEWNDVVAPLQIMTARSRLAQLGRLTGNPIGSMGFGVDFVDERSLLSYLKEIKPLTDLLDACARPDLQARWPAEAVPAFRRAIEAMLHCAYVQVPEVLKEIEDQILLLEMEKEIGKEG